MECQDVRQLFAFAERGSEQLDPIENAAIQKHLESCPDCAAALAQERSADQALGTAMRDVAVPAGLKMQILGRLAMERGQRRWKRWGLAAAAAALLLATAAATWHILQPPTLTTDDMNRIAEISTAWSDGWTRASAQDNLEKRGLAVRAPDRFNYQYLRYIDIIIVHDRPVARLVFRNDHAIATVLIARGSQFRLSHYDESGENGTMQIKIRQQEGFVYVIQSNDLQALENGPF